MGAGGHLVGRDSERELVARLLRDGASGQPGALLVAGEPGIGKTTLVAEATSGPGAEEHLVLWGRCLRFGADSSPYLPWVQILTQWHRQADDDERRQVLAGADDLATIAPSLGTDAGTTDSTRMVPLICSVLDRIAARRPLVLVVDDVQWADGSSLDLLAYLVAGFAPGQRLSLVATYRDTELVEGHRLHGWLADLVRMPSVDRIRLERLGYADTEELVRRTGGDTPAGFAEELFARTDGNPYYTELLVSGVDPTGGTGLREALLSSWHRLGAEARELLQLLAIGGRPVAVEVLERLVAKRGGPEGVPARLAEAAAAGLVTVGPDGEAWFHHPLIAEVVGSTLPPRSQQDLHLEYVAVLESLSDLAPVERSAHLALHHDGAGDRASAFTWSLRAADEAAAVHGYAETADHLHRACRLYDQLDEGDRAEAGGRTELWLRACESAWSAGEFELALRLRREAIAAADPAHDPALAIRARFPVMHWGHVTGFAPELQSATSAEALLELAVQHCEGSAEHAQALAQLAFSEAWDGDPEASRRHASEAVHIGRRIGSSRALAWGLAMRSQTAPSASAGLADALQALPLGREVDDPVLVGVTSIGCANCYERLGRRSDAADVLLTAFDHLKATHSVYDAMWTEPEYAAALLLEMGRWTEAREVLRQLLGQRQPPGHAAEVRGLAAILAFRSGDHEAGRLHLARALELPGNRGAGGLVGFLAVEGLWQQGDLRDALAAATDRMGEEMATSPVLSAADELIALAAHVAADLAEQPGAREEAVSLLSGMEALLLRDGESTATATHDDALHRAYRQIYRAERARCHADPEASAQWRVTVADCRAADLVWEEALASYQLGRSLLAERGPRAEAAAALRDAARVASGLGAAPILRDVEGLARQAHIRLDEAASPPAVAGDGMGATLTPREREVLAHLVAGRTYAEIARELFISEKTVSVHVSNLLRKTGTSSRIELAELARRA